jgi:hypothetical protein
VYGAIDAGLIMEVAKMKEMELEELQKTDEGRKELARREIVTASFNNVPNGAKAYQLVKCSRHKRPENQSPAPFEVGTGGSGYVRVMSDALLAYNTACKKDDLKISDFPGIPWECQLKAKPKIGSVFYVGDVGNWLRTSIVKAYYLHDDPDGYVEHPDKLVLPTGFPLEAAMNLPELQAGDIVISTMNSIYLCREMDSKYDYVQTVEKEETAA